MDWPPTLLDHLTPGEMVPRDRLLRDLGRILNSRTSAVADEHPVLSASVLGYGLPHMDDEIQSRPDRLDSLCTLIARKIELFEPRLQKVRVRPGSIKPPRVWLRIEAEIIPLPQPFVAAIVLRAGGRFELERTYEQ